METKDPAIVIPILILFFLIFGGIFTGILYYYFKKLKKLKREPIDFQGEKIEIPLLATFLGFKGIKFLAFGYNNLNPKLHFLRDQIEFKCFRTQKRPYSEIEQVDVLRANSLATQNLELYFKNSSFRYAFNVVNADTLKKAVSFLDQKGCPLSAQARNFLKELNPLVPSAF